MATDEAEADTEHEPPQSNETVVGDLEPDVAAALSYVLGPLTGIIFYLLETENDHVRFHAAQSIVVFGAYLVVTWVIGIIQTAIAAAVGIGPGGAVVFGLLSLVFSLVSLAVWIGGLGLWLYLLVRTYQGEDPRIPVAEGIAESLA